MKITKLLSNISLANKIGYSLADTVKYELLIYKIFEKTKINFLRKYTIKFIFSRFSIPIKLEIRSNNGSDSFIFSEVFINKCYEIPFNDVPATIMDLGANVGFTTVFYSCIFPYCRFACVEPMLTNLEQLKKNLTYNNINATIFNAAAAVTDGTVFMDTCTNDYGHKVSDIQYGRDVNSSTKTEVRSLTIATLLEELQWQTIDLLKIDIEGYEGVLFSSNNDWLNSVNSIVMELHEGVMEEDIINIAKSFKFHQFRHFNGNLLMSKGFIKE